MAQPDPYRTPSQPQRVQEARVARARLPIVWFVLAGTIALVFAVGIALAVLL
jgi:hypothetical protein